MKKIVKKIVIVLLVVVGIYGLLQVGPYKGYSGNQDNAFCVADGEAPLVISHGGAKELYPENTVYAFEQSFEMGVDVLEMDICITSDDVIITQHNTTVDAYTEFEGLVSDYTYDEIVSMNYGYDFTDLDGEYPYRDADLIDEEILSKLVPMKVDDLFSTYGTDILYIIEVKNEGQLGYDTASQLLDLIYEYELEDYVCLASFHLDVIEYILSVKSDDIILSMDLTTATDFVTYNYAGIGAFYSWDFGGLQLPTSYGGIPLDNFYLEYKIEKNGMFVHYWTINDKETMIDLIKLGCDGIITDRPDLMFEVLEELGY